MKNIAVTIVIFGALIGVGYYIVKQHRKGIEDDIAKNF